MTRDIREVAIVGVGLIGASLGRALHRALPRATIIGVGRSESNLDDALAVGAIDQATTDTAKGVGNADVVVLGVPVEQGSAVLKIVAKSAKKAAIFSDVGSTKTGIVQGAADLGLADRFVGAHPMAGGTATGAAAADASLFEGKTVVITPEPGSRADAVETISSIWQKCGATIVKMSAEEHDRAVAMISHVPQLLAYALASAAGQAPNNETALKLAGSGFADMTRLAESAESVWAGIFRENRREILAALGSVEGEIQALGEAIKSDDAKSLGASIAAANDALRKQRGL